MFARKPALPVDNPSVLIRSRIRGKRIFEARFLCRQLGAEIGDRERGVLERELAGLLAQVEKLQQQARQHIAAGRNDLAEALYRDIERIAIDVPGVSEERKRLQGAKAIIAKVTGMTSEERTAGPAEPAAAPVVPEKGVFAAELRQRLQRLPRLWLLVLGLCCLALLLSFFRGIPKEQVLPVSSPSVPSPHKQTISIRPLDASPPTVTAQPDQEADPVEPPAEAASPPSPALKLGELQIQASPRE